MENNRAAASSGRLKNLRTFRLRHGVVIEAPADDHISKAFHRGLFYEGAMLEHIRQVYPPGMNVVDVGAHIGNHTLFFAKACSANVVAVEPNEELCRQLRRNVELNSICGCKVAVYRAALGGHYGWVSTIEWPAGNTGMGRCEIIRPAGILSGGEVPAHVMDSAIPMEALDDRLEDWGMTAVDLLKIDAEGMGLDVLQGARKLIARDRPGIFIECHTEMDRLQVEVELRPFGYQATNVFNATDTWEFVPR